MAWAPLGRPRRGSSHHRHPDVVHAATPPSTAANPASQTIDTTASIRRDPFYPRATTAFLLTQHNGSSMAVGDNYIGQVVQAIQNGPQWNATAIFITYDDCGCFYDHVRPPAAGLGLRNPMVIVSPYAKPGYTDSTVASQPYSMLAFIDHTFGLSDLSPQVARAYDYANSFDFTRSARAEPHLDGPHPHLRCNQAAGG